MGVVTLRLPDDTHQRIKALAASRNMSVNKLFEELSVMALTEFDAETRFRIRAARGSRKRGIEILDQLDQHYQDSSKIRT